MYLGHFRCHKWHFRKKFVQKGGFRRYFDQLAQCRHFSFHVTRFVLTISYCQFHLNYVDNFFHDSWFYLLPSFISLSVIVSGDCSKCIWILSSPSLNYNCRDVFCESSSDVYLYSFLGTSHSKASMKRKLSSVSLDAAPLHSALICCRPDIMFNTIELRHHRKLEAEFHPRIGLSRGPDWIPQRNQLM